MYFLSLSPSLGHQPSVPEALHGVLHYSGQCPHRDCKQPINPWSELRNTCLEFQGSILHGSFVPIVHSPAQIHFVCIVGFIPPLPPAAEGWTLLPPSPDGPVLVYIHSQPSPAKSMWCLWFTWYILIFIFLCVL